MKYLSNDDFKILKISFIVMLFLIIFSLCLALCFNCWQFSWALSILIGYLASVLNYVKLVYIVTNVTNFVYHNPKKVFILNNISSLLVYFIVLLVNVLIPIFNIFLCFLGIIIIKIIIIILFGKQSSKGGK